VRVTAEIFHYPVWAAEGWFNVDHPVDPFERCGQCEESGGLAEWRDRPGEAEKISEVWERAPVELRATRKKVSDRRADSCQRPSQPSRFGLA
jgi:hypothetical protein